MWAPVCLPLSFSFPDTLAPLAGPELTSIQQPLFIELLPALGIELEMKEAEMNSIESLL